MHVHFIPWRAKDSLEDVFNTLVWHIEALLWKRRYIHVVNYRGRNAWVLKFASTGTVYVHGHGAPGDDSISNKGAPVRALEKFHLEPDAIDLPADEVANRLKWSGLPTSYAGKIKCWSCQSGVDQNGKTCFASKFAKAMRNRGYTLCTYYGYLGMVDPFYKGRHRRSTPGGQGQGGRASQDRVPIPPDEHFLQSL